jgi:hypothetical protein
VTVSTVPKGRLGLAHVPPAVAYHDAVPVTEFFGGGGGGGAVVVVVVDGGGGGGAVVVVGATTLTAGADVVEGVGGTVVGVTGAVVVGTFSAPMSVPAPESVVKATGADDSDGCPEEVAAASGRGRAAVPASCRPAPATRDTVRPGVANRRSGTTPRAMHSITRAMGRNPPAVVLRPPPFVRGYLLWGLRVDRVGVDCDHRRPPRSAQLKLRKRHCA